MTGCRFFIHQLTNLAFAFGIILVTLCLGMSFANAAADADAEGYSCTGTTHGSPGFKKWIETASESDYFEPKIKVLYSIVGYNGERTLGHGECGWMAGVRFCARYAWPAGTEIPEGRALTDDNDDNLTDADSPGYSTTDCGLNPNVTVFNQARLCAYEDPLDGADTDPDYEQYHENEPNINYIDYSNAYLYDHNHIVTTNLGCVDVPLAPGPPPFCATLQSPYPRPSVFKVSTATADFNQNIYPSNVVSDINLVGHPDNWRYKTNDNWFYPRIGVMIGSNFFNIRTNDGYVVDESARDVAVLEGDFYQEESSSTNSTRGNPRKVTLTLPAGAPGGLADQDITYNIETSVQDNKVCAYLMSSSHYPLKSTPDRLGCVDRPETYTNSNGQIKKGPPTAQLYQPITEGISIFNAPKAYIWLQDDPRLNVTPAEFASYGTLTDAQKKAFFDSKIGTNKSVLMPLATCDQGTGENDPFNLEALYRPHRLHGYLYCMERVDENGNQYADPTEVYMCASNVPVYTATNHGERIWKLRQFDFTPTRLQVVSTTNAFVEPGGAVQQNATAPGYSFNRFIPGTKIYDECSNHIAWGTPNANAVLTGAIVPTGNCDIEQRTDTGLYAKFRIPPDAYRGEIQLQNIDGTYTLYKIVDANNNGPTTGYLSNYVLPYTYNNVEYHPDRIPNQCDSVLQSDKTLQNVCYYNPPARDAPDPFRGETLVTPFDLGMKQGFCTLMPAARCPAEVGASGTNVAQWYEAIGLLSSDPGYGSAEGVCNTGYAGDSDGDGKGNYGMPPTRICEKTGGSFTQTTAQWGAITRSCQRVYCNAYSAVDSVRIGYTSKIDPVKWNCKWKQTGSNSYDHYDCDNAGTVRDEPRKKLCQPNGTWADYTCEDDNLSGCTDFRCDVGMDVYECQALCLTINSSSYCDEDNIEYWTNNDFP